MTNATNTKSTAAATDAEAVTIDLPDRSEVTRTLNILKLTISDLYNDARRRNPYFATNKQEAVAKLNAALKVLNEFSGQLDSIKKG
ncbi:hypothetical protein BFL35_14850 [Clavibacter michiganensis]|nr:hypothetical protein BFL35_14850 [Clavibacter michiganensis]